MRGLGVQGLGLVEEAVSLCEGWGSGFKIRVRQVLRFKVYGFVFRHPSQRPAESSIRGEGSRQKLTDIICS